MSEADTPVDSAVDGRVNNGVHHKDPPDFFISWNERKRRRRGDERTEAQKQWTEKQKIPQWELAWELNRINRIVEGPLIQEDITEHSEYSKTAYRNMFGSLTKMLRASNIIPPIDYVTRALHECGISYVTTRNLRSWMYPRCDSRSNERYFGADRTVPDNPRDKDVLCEQDVIDSWEYPRLSSSTVGQILTDIANRDEPTQGIELSVWSDAQKPTYKVTRT